MKVLWITNTLFPAISKEIGSVEYFAQGWVYAGAKAILDLNDEMELAVATYYTGKVFIEKKINNITYFLLPKQKNQENDWKYIKDSFKPVVVHVQGTEYEYGLSYVKACGSHAVVVSIQGLVSVIEKYYFGGIKLSHLLKSTTLRDIIRWDFAFNQKKNMKRRGTREIRLLRNVGHVIGRTSWDRAHCWAINPEAKYHFCNETLRESFYNKKWALKNCQPHTIFLSQAHYPIKGIQQVIKALPLIQKEYPDTKVYVAGHDFFNIGWRKNGFGNYINKLLKQSNKDSKIEFLGILTEEEMVDKYLNAHVFVCPSIIENSPNSLGEAQLLGVPSVSSHVGGVLDMVKDGETGLVYRYEEYEMLAKAVCNIFSDNNLAERLSINSRNIASERHDRLMNAKELISIYKSVCNYL